MLTHYRIAANNEQPCKNAYTRTEEPHKRLPLALNHSSFNATPLSPSHRLHSPIPPLPLHRHRCNNNPLPHTLHLLAIHARRRPRVHDPRAHLVPSLEVYVFDVEGVDVAWEVAQECEQQVDEEVGAAAGDEEDAEGWDWVVLVVGWEG